MSSNILLDALIADGQARGNKDEHYFDHNASVISYKTGLPPLDYYLGYKVYIPVNKNKPDMPPYYENLGITAGSYVCLVGRPGTAKTAFAIGVAGNIIAPFKNSLCIHLDIEGAANYSRVQSLTKLPMDFLNSHYIIRQERLTLDDIKAMFIRIYKQKMQNKAKLSYDTGIKNEFGEPIIMLEPTVVIIDSIAAITAGLEADGSIKTLEKLEEVSSQTDRMRLTGDISRFFNEILPICKEGNIIVLAVNQLKNRSNIGPFSDAAMVLGFRQDEAPSAGWGPIFNAQILLKFIASGNYTKEDDGFSGFDVRIKIIKSRVSAGNREVSSVFDRNTGFDMVRSSVKFALDNGFVTGNKAHYKFKDSDITFTGRNMVQDFKDKPELYKIMHDAIVPYLKSELSGISPEELSIPVEQTNFYSL